MENDIAQQIEQRIAQLPEDVRNAVLSVEWEAKVQAVATRHKLHIDQSGVLGDTTLMAMLGFFAMPEYPTRVAQDLKIAPEEAAAIAKEVSDEVFMPIRESLRKFTEAKGQPATSATTAPATAAAATTPTPPKIEAKPAPKPDLSSAESMLSAKMVTVPPMPAPKPVPATPPTTAPAAPAAAAPTTPATTAATKTEPPKPQAYAADPYREPPV